MNIDTQLELDTSDPFHTTAYIMLCQEVGRPHLFQATGHEAVEDAKVARQAAADAGHLIFMA